MSKCRILKPGWVLLAAIAGLAGLLIAGEIVHLAGEVAALGPAWSHAIFVLSVVAGACTAWVITCEIMGWCRVGRIDRLREHLQQTHRPLEELEPRVLAWRRRLPVGSAVRARFDSCWSIAVCRDDRGAAQEAIDELLTQVDRDVDAVIRREAARCGVLVSLSGIGLIDAALSVWCTLRVMRRTATAYGARPGLAGTARLARMVLVHAVAIDLAQHAADAVSSRAGVLAGAGVQGLAAATLVVRVGLWTQQACRPVAAPRRTIVGFVAASAAQGIGRRVRRTVARMSSGIRASAGTDAVPASVN